MQSFIDTVIAKHAASAATTDVADSTYRTMAIGVADMARSLLSRPSEREKYLLWRKQQFEMGNPLGLTPIPDDLHRSIA